MTKNSCKLADCTVQQTGICLLSHVPTECENFVEGSVEATGEVDVDEEPATERTSKSGRKFHSGLELGTEEAAELMRGRYCYLIGILGSTDAGKTCLMISLYLMAACGDLGNRFAFSSSLTLQGFEDRARKLRKWEKGLLPKRLADHTNLTDPRVPSLLHMALLDLKHIGRSFDLLLTDLPGEWTTDLIESAGVASRFDFLHRADGIVLVIDGVALSGENKHVEVYRLQVLMRRLAEEVQVCLKTPFVILVSRGDELDGVLPTEVSKLVSEAQALGFCPQVVLAAAFSNKPTEIPNGMGVIATIEKMLEAKTSIEPVMLSVSNEERAFGRYRL